MISGGQLLAESLAAHGVGPMFGMGGFQLLPFYEGVRALGLRHYLINDERCGAFAADAYARVSGRVGVCDATLGPGATNLVTALVESRNAGIPVVAIVGDAHRGYAGRNMTQEGPQVEILRPAVKELLRAEAPERIPELVSRAFAVATSGRPGPVVLDIPEDVAHGSCARMDQHAQPVTLPRYRTRPDAADVERAAAALRASRRPLILAGGGVHLSGAYQQLAALGIPVAHTLSGKGSLACTDELSAGLFGRYSTIANDLIEAADCLVAVGCKLGEIATRRYSLLPAGTPLIQIDVVAEEIGRCADVSVGLCGDAAATLADLRAALGPLSLDSYRADVASRRERWWRDSRDRHETEAVPVSMARLMHELNLHLPPSAVVVADGGFASHWAGLLYRTKRAGRAFVADRGFASIGYGLPGAIGAWLASGPASGPPFEGGGPVVALTGDGGMNMTLGELETARRIGADLTVIVVNNGASGYVKALQHAVYGPGSYQSSDLFPIDYAAVARELGCRGVRVDRPDQLRAAVKTAVAGGDTPLVIDVAVTTDPAQMLPGVDNRALTVTAGDRPV